MALFAKLALALCAIFGPPFSLPLADASRTPIQPDRESAQANAHHIFNAIHSAGRQWGSSLKHNGFSFFPVVMSKGSLLYHGTPSNSPPPGPEWLAFEVEHAEAFVLFKTPRGNQQSQEPRMRPGQKPLGHSSSREASKPHDKNMRGYLHTYRAERDLNLLYVDGMSAAKTHKGTLDSQDLVLRENNTSPVWDPFMDELTRASDICDLIKEWGYDGFMRMEIGFEVIYCDFSVGVDLMTAKRTVPHHDQREDELMNPYQWVRAVAERYDGLGGDRVRIDFSSMVSGYFFPINISNTDPERPDLHRLAAAGLDELKDIKSRVRGVFTEPRRFTVNWQAVVDMIVTRFSGRLRAMASSKLSSSKFISELAVASLSYFDAPPLPGDITMMEDKDKNRTAEAVDACIKHYLLPTYLDQDSWSLEDGLIHAAIETVMSGICTKLFAMRSIILEVSSATPPFGPHIPRDGDKEQLDKAVEASRRIVHTLREELAWTTWRMPQVCPIDELLLTVMWPMGDPEDYWNPGCRPIDEISFSRRGYWRPDI
ncbi:Uncharacterized protein TOPH_03850 [Tolypocladium ophioglossoides CBS 100239]|uniref:Uncharacterized protein n=1 Tax=Tolypocladium ophioglossoides (strain CBS 100239) TaxID=1163406 RepID=A0A0L0NBY8_TOLOC|nr:Uncharacterized protein TOPH_03850 [Tolypocladium ophioglossoides CBS 100239]